MNARVETHRDGGADVVVLHGELDHQTAPTVERDVLLATRASERVVLDLAGLTWFDSAGVTVLDRVVRSCGQRGIPVRVSVPDDAPARTVLRIVAFPEDLLHADAGAAVQALVR